MAGTVAPTQSSARPFGLQPIADVMLAGTDAESAAFQASEYNGLMNIVNNTLTESQSQGDISMISLAVNDLYLTEQSNVRAYYLSEGAGYRNSVGFYTGDASDQLSGDAALMFPNASETSSLYTQYYGAQPNSAPLLSGDFVDMGEFDADTQLNLFLIANGASGGTNTYYTDGSLNADGIDHFIVLATPDSPYLLVGVEDLYGGGDEDYNDVVMALDIGTVNAQKLISNAVPLPGPVAVLLGPLLFMGWRKIRKSNTPDDQGIEHAETA